MSTISSRAVSGSSTTVKVALSVEIDAAEISASRLVADATVIDVAPDVIAEVNVVC
jgi:hypothetical protein